jgi:hydrogenase maturation protease
MELGRVLDRMPQQLIVYAIEVADVSIGVELSASLAAAVPVLVDAVLGELEHTDIG